MEALPKFDLQGKVALVSGGARGLGASIGRLFVREGAAVMPGSVGSGSREKMRAWPDLMDVLSINFAR